MLAEQKKKQSTSSSSSMHEALSTDAELTSKTRASKSRQAKAKNEPPPNAASTIPSADGNAEILKQQSNLHRLPTKSTDLTTTPAMPTTSSSAAATPASAEDVSALQLLVQQQQLTIDALQHKLNFVLEFLGAADFDFNSLPMKPVTDDCTTSSAALADSATANSLTTLPSRVQYSIAVSQGDMNKPKKKSLNPFEQAVLTTVNSENRRKIARLANVVVSGLPTSSMTTDTELAQRLFRDELSLQSNIVSCQRLGKPSPGKTQLLKVCMSDTSEAAEILAAAKRLRHSADNYIRQHVFINRDMTKSEAEAAYQARCLRRLKRGNQNQQQSPTSPHRNPNKKQPTSLYGDTQSSFTGQTNPSHTQQQFPILLSPKAVPFLPLLSHPLPTSVPPSIVDGRQA
jgi:hypothetical protein